MANQHMHETQHQDSSARYLPNTAAREERADQAQKGQYKTAETLNEKIVRWADDPMRSVVVATGATIGSFGLVLGGIGAIQMTLQ